MVWHRALQRGLGRAGAALEWQRRAAFSSLSQEEYGKLNVASDVFGYNKVMSDLCVKRRPYLLRDVYDDMLMDGVQPEFSTFTLLITGTMRGRRLQDVMHFFNEMKSMGMTPNHLLFNCVISACGKSNQISRAFQVASEMESYGLEPKQRTYVALLNACGAAGCPEEAEGVLRKMRANGLPLDEFCYSALMMAHKNKKPVTSKTFDQIFELLEECKAEQAKAKLSPSASSGENGGASLDEEIGSAIAGGGVFSVSGGPSGSHVAHLTAVVACAELGNEQAMTKAVQILEQDGFSPDNFTFAQIVKCYVNLGSFDKAFAVFNSLTQSGRDPTLDMFVTMVEGLLLRVSQANLASAKWLLEEMDARGFFLNSRIGSGLLLRACAVPGDLAVANLIWDMMMKHDVKPTIRGARAFQSALQARLMPASDPRMSKAREFAARFPSYAERITSKDEMNKDDFDKGEA